jgi:hypothetical protein
VGTGGSRPPGAESHSTKPPRRATVASAARSACHVRLERARAGRRRQRHVATR